MNTDLLIATFNENITYIETSHPKLFSKLLALDNAVSNGHYQEKYEIVFDNGYFDVLEKGSGNYLYGKDSSEYASLAASSVGYDLVTNLFNCSPDHDISDEKLQYYQKLPLLEDYMSGMAEVFHFIQHKSLGKEKLQSLQKFIFFGVGLGLHIESIDKKINASNYLIVEDDLELFRLSLFTLNYKNLAQNATLYFSVFDESEEFTLMSEKFLEDSYEDNKYIKYFEMLSHSESSRQAFHLSVTNQAHLRFSYSSMLKQSLLPLEHLSDEFQFLSKGVTLRGSKLEDKPFLLLGAGPSLGKNIKLLKKREDDFIIVAVSATLRLLEKEGVVPDVVVHLDAFSAATKHFDLDSIDFIKDSICIFSAKTTPLITWRLDKKNIYFYEDSTKYKENSFRPSSSCVGSMAYQILLYLKVKNIYLLGLDLAVDAKTGKTHSDGHAYVKELDLSINAYNEQEIEYKKHLIEIVGNRGENVKTTPHFKTSIEAINLSTQMLKEQNQNIINLGNGAMLENTESSRLDNLKLSYSKSKPATLLGELLSKNLCRDSEKSIKSNFTKKLEKSAHAKKVLLSFNALKVKTKDEYKRELLVLVDTLTDGKEEELERVYDVYFRYLLPYIFDFLNREELELKEDDFTMLSGMIVEHLVRIS